VEPNRRLCNLRTARSYQEATRKVLIQLRKLPGTNLQVLDEEAALILVLGGRPMVPQVI
jgi:hypothetical protein